VVKVRNRELILVVVLGPFLGLMLTACGGGDDDKKPSADSTRLGSPTASLTETTIDCGRYNDTAQEIIEAQTKIFSGTEAEVAAAADALDAQLEALKKGAPDDVKAALSDLSAAFDDVVELRKNPSSDAQTRLAALGAKLSEDGQKIAAYVISKCR